MDYLHFFYCICGNYPALGYTSLLLWLILLFYLLGSTAARYFCSNLEGLTRLLKLSPTTAGVALLALGNGAPDIFSSSVSFMEPDTDVVGPNSILGAAFFVSSVVAGSVSICVGPRGIIIDRLSFMRDLGFLLLVSLVFLPIITIGNINVFVALGFTSLYLVYVLLVSIGHLFCELRAPLLSIMEEMDESILVEEEGQRTNEPDSSTRSCSEFVSSTSSCFPRILKLLELPLYLPTRSTIPDVEERWSKPFAVASAAFAPVLPAVIWDSKSKEKATEERMAVGGLIGMAFGTAAFLKTRKDRPPTTFLRPWLAGGFFMSAIWVYIIAASIPASMATLKHVILDIVS